MAGSGRRSTLEKIHLPLPPAHPCLAFAQVVEVVLPTFIMKPEETEVFYPSEVKKIAETVINETLDGKEYDEDIAKEWVISMSEQIKAGVKTLSIPRYKTVVQVTVGQMKDQGVRVASRCLWDTATDNYASYSYQNATLWCNAMIFGVYTE